MSSDEVLEGLNAYLTMRLPILQRDVTDTWDTLQRYGATSLEKMKEFEPTECNCDKIEGSHYSISVKDLASLSGLAAFTLTKDARQALKENDVVIASMSADVALQMLAHALSCLLSVKLARDKDRVCTMLNGRHASSREAKDMVCAKWAENIYEFPSIEKAGRHYAAWLEDLGHLFEPRTVRDWIRVYAKEKGIKLR